MLVDLLAYSRIGRMPAMGEVDLAQALDTAVAGLKMPAGMRLVRQIGCCAAVMGEQDAILLWSALIGNAIKHHHARDGHIVAETCAEGEMIRLSVSDDGPGIPHHFRARALGAMTTLRPRDEVEGTGMGLAHVSKIAACYGGTVSILDGQGGDGLRIDVLIRREVRGPLRPDTPPI
jgi:signal transduction histidine kinase